MARKQTESLVFSTEKPQHRKGGGNMAIANEKLRSKRLNKTQNFVNCMLILYTGEKAEIASLLIITRHF